MYIDQQALLVNIQGTYIATTQRSRKKKREKNSVLISEDVDKYEIRLYMEKQSVLQYQIFQEFHKHERKALYVFITKDMVIETIFSLISLDFKLKCKFIRDCIIIRGTNALAASQKCQKLFFNILNQK